MPSAGVALLPPPFEEDPAPVAVEPGRDQEHVGDGRRGDLHRAPRSSSRPSRYRPYDVFRSALGELPETAGVDVAHAVGDLLGAGDLEALALLDRLDEQAGLEQRLVGAGIEPRGAAAQQLDLERAQGEVARVDVGDLELAPGRGPDLAGDVAHPVVVEVEPGDGVVGLGPGGLLLDADGAAVPVELEHAVGPRLLHVVAEDGGARRPARGALKRLAQVVAVEDVVAQHQAAVVRADEVAADEERLRDPVGRGLGGVGQREPPLLAAAEQPLERREVLRGRDDQHVPDPAQHQRGERVVDHRLVVDRQELLADPAGHGVQAGARAAGQDEALAGPGVDRGGSGRSLSRHACARAVIVARLGRRRGAASVRDDAQAGMSIGCGRRPSKVS